jgi:glycosyltransferase involved in cell wall biosynthesis
MKRKKITPKISVILPVYNGADFIGESINSILSQSFNDFELIIINDGSNDSSDSIIMNFKDDRIIYHKQNNAGLAATLNKAILLSSGEYVARQDQDDISLIDRLLKQCRFLDEHQDVGVVGTRAQIYNKNKPSKKYFKHPVGDLSIKFGLLFNNYLVHSSVMIRSSLLKLAGNYSEDLLRQPPEDYELWSRLIKLTKFANLSEILLIYNEIDTSMSRRSKNPFLEKVIKISTENISWLAKIPKNNAEVIALANLMNLSHNFDAKNMNFSRLYSLMLKLEQLSRANDNIINNKEIKEFNSFLIKIKVKFFISYLFFYIKKLKSSL